MSNAIAGEINPYRRAPSVEAGIKENRVYGPTRYIRYEPDNGTTYRITLTDLRLMGCAMESAWLFALKDGPCFATMLDGGYVGNYVLAKFREAVRGEAPRYNINDCTCIAELLNHVSQFEPIILNPVANRIEHLTLSVRALVKCGELMLGTLLMFRQTLPDMPKAVSDNFDKLIGAAELTLLASNEGRPLDLPGVERKAVTS